MVKKNFAGSHSRPGAMDAAMFNITINIAVPVPDATNLPVVAPVAVPIALPVPLPSKGKGKGNGKGKGKNYTQIKGKGKANTEKGKGKVKDKGTHLKGKGKDTSWTPRQLTAFAVWNAGGDTDDADDGLPNAWPMQQRIWVIQQSMDCWMTQIRCCIGQTLWAARRWRRRCRRRRSTQRWQRAVGGSR